MFTYNLKTELEKYSDIESDLINRDTFHLKGLKKVTSLEMTNEILNYIKNNKNKKKEKIDFIVEYPFMDWNPITLLALIYLKKNFKNSKMIVSIHEYYRVNILRRKAIDFLISIADGYIITDSNLYQKINGQKILRSIPSNILKESSIKKIERDSKSYCYFGLINKSKAFNEMIEAWKEFNKDKIYKLNIYTASDINIENIEKYNIQIFKDLDNKELSKELQKNSFMILPIVPNIDSNNGTLKAAATHGCIPIGIFSSNMNSLGVNIKDQKYTIENIKEALENSLNLNKKDENLKLKEYSETFSFEKNARDIYNFLRSKEWRNS